MRKVRPDWLSELSSLLLGALGLLLVAAVAASLGVSAAEVGPGGGRLGRFEVEGAAQATLVGADRLELPSGVQVEDVRLRVAIPDPSLRQHVLWRLAALPPLAVGGAAVWLLLRGRAGRRARGPSGPAGEAGQEREATSRVSPGPDLPARPLKAVRAARAGDPFTVGNVRRLRTLAAVVGIGGTLASFLAGALRKELLRTTPAAPMVASTFQLLFLPLVLGLVVLALAEVFAHGTRLRTDLEGVV